jgi:hypothetical protein
MAKDNRPLIATIEERTIFSSGGSVAVILLFVFQVLIIFAWGSTKSAVQEASLGTVWIAGNILLGIGAIIGRRRSYRVLRELGRDVEQSRAAAEERDAPRPSGGERVDPHFGYSKADFPDVMDGVRYKVNADHTVTAGTPVGERTYSNWDSFFHATKKRRW